MPENAGHTSYDVLGLGCTAVDDLLYIGAFPEPDSKIQVRRSERQCGGLTATALVAAARLGARCAFAGVLGQDADSNFVRGCLEREGIDTGPAVFHPGARPIHSTILVDERANTRTILFDLTGSAGADPAAPPADVIRSCRVLFVDHYGVEGMTRAARLARAAGVAVVADFERHEYPGFAALLALVDHLIVSRDFAHRLLGESDPVQAARQLWAEGRDTVAVTAGEQGCWYRTAQDTDVRHQPAFRVSVVDTTGCGDVFHGAYAAALAQGMAASDRIRFASAAAALKAMRPGAQAGIPDGSAVKAFLSDFV
ncbi:MAG TPA: PfkB family carbohydrate kinase [Gemmataceae bacterium]|nr:PfkB family carbohydrate kinase [Gemmataceae bacterium]